MSSPGKRRYRATSATAALAILIMFAGTAHAQRSSAELPTEPISKFGVDLDDAQAGALLDEMREMTSQALDASVAAQQAASVAEIKTAAGQVLEAVWGIPVEVSGDAVVQFPVPSWKERWQVNGSEFSADYAERLGTKPPAITDPTELGLFGRGRAARYRLQQIADSASSASAAQREAAGKAIASLNDVIGYMHMSYGFKGREIQPRVSLTQEWDMPPAFWNSTADTGWLYEVYSQAANILKTDYDGDVATAREHVTALADLLRKVQSGVDADENGTIEPVMMEGGLDLAIAQAALAGIPIE